jgi:thiol-disulfide isomerase/thioredoxin
MSLLRLALLLLCVSGLARAGTGDPQSDAFWYGTAADGTPTVRLYYFFSPTCPHCQAAKPFIAELQASYPWLEVKRYSVRDQRGNAQFYYETAQTLGVEALSVPGLVFCRQIIIGYDSAETTGRELAEALQACHERRLASPGATNAGAAAGGGAASDATLPPDAAEKQAGTTVNIPFVGPVDAKAFSLPVLTLVLAAMNTK